MPDPVTTGLASLSLGLRTVDGLSSLAKKGKEWLEENKEKDVGKVYYKVRELMEQRALLHGGDNLVEKPSAESKRLTPVKSPNVKALINLFGKDEHTGDKYESGVVYVLYDKAGNGKSHAGRALLQNFYALSGNKTISGFMISGDVMDNNIPEEFSKRIGATSVEGWIHLLLLAMDVPIELHPSILIIDSFNTLGTDNINETFIKALYSQMNAERNIFVVVLTQNEEIAQALINLNGGQRVVPLPGCFSGERTSPIWKETPWKREELIEVLHYKFPGKFNDQAGLGFVKEGMTPLEVIKKARTRLRTSDETPDSPEKKRFKMGSA
jgi:hypothetical protein